MSILFVFFLSTIHTKRLGIQSKVESIKYKNCVYKEKGNITVVKQPTTYALVELYLLKSFKYRIRPGGAHAPEICLTVKKVAIIIPFRDRMEQLYTFLRHMHPFLINQMINYQIFVVDQIDKLPFNRASLLNIGYDQAIRFQDFDCFIFTDVDLLPENLENMYDCPKSPLHMGAYIDLYSYELMYEDILGGTIAFLKNDFIKINGFSNCYWGWGGEDDDVLFRLKEINTQYSRVDPSYRYSMNKISHSRINSEENRERNRMLKKAVCRWRKDGLKSLEYKLISTSMNTLYTHLKVNLNKQYKTYKTALCYCN